MMSPMLKRPLVSSFARSSSTRFRTSDLLGASLVACLLAAGLAGCSSDDGGDEPAAGSGGGTGSASGGADGTGSGGGGTSDPSQLPSDTSQAGIQAFLDAGTYKTWVHDPAPRPNSQTAFKPHGDSLQVYFNAIAAAAGSEGAPAAGGMVVKEIYDETSGSQVGTAVSIRLEGSSKWIYYCTNPGGILCSGFDEDTDPIYDTGGGSCSGCHGDTIFSPLPQ